MKTYASKSNAKRAAKNLSYEYDILPTDDGKWTIVEIKPEPAKKVATKGPTPLQRLKDKRASQTHQRLPEGKIVLNRRSTTEGPCRLVWDIAEEMFAANPDTRRKDVIDECQRQGVAFYTARTQYQAWKRAVEGK